MKRTGVGAIIGILLIVAGVLFLLDSLHVLPMAEYIWPALFLVVGLVFLYVFLSNRALNWWAIIPALSLLGLAATIAVETFVPGDVSGAAIFLAALGLSFLIVYLVNRQYWWAIIPAGSLFSVAVLVALSETIQDETLAAVFFLGLALTFGALALVRTPEGRLKWALIPALVMLALALLMVTLAGAAAPYIWSVALIVLGLYFLYRALSRPRKGA